MDAVLHHVHDDRDRDRREALHAWRAKARCSVVPAERLRDLFEELHFSPTEKQSKYDAYAIYTRTNARNGRARGDNLHTTTNWRLNARRDVARNSARLAARIYARSVRRYLLIYKSRVEVNACVRQQRVQVRSKALAGRVRVKPSRRIYTKHRDVRSFT